MLKTPSLGFLATSGHESVKRDEQVYQPCTVQEEEPIEVKPIEAQQRTRDSLPDQDRATFPGASNMSATELDDLKSELPERLYSDLCLIDPAFNTVATLRDAIPSLLRSFAIRLGSHGSSKVPMEIMLFVYKSRDKISAALSELVEDSNQQGDSSKSPDKSSVMLDDAILDWRANIESGEVPTVPQPDIEERPAVINERGYRELVFNSVAYKWLVAGLMCIGGFIGISAAASNIHDISAGGNHQKSELEDDTTVRCEFKKSGLTVQVEGITDSIATIGEQIGWLGAALRPSSSGTEFATCRPIFGTCNPSISKSRPAECFIAFLTTPMGATKDRPGQCWHAIFRNPVMVEGYPIPRRKRYGSGLEMPLNVMAGLNSSPRIHKYGGNYYLKGYSTALVPTEKIGNMVLWHFYYSDDGSRLPYPNPTGLRCVDLSMQDLTAARHVVGWCSNANFKTGAADMNYAIGASKLQRPGKEFALEKISFSFGQFITGGCQFAIGRKDQHVRATKGTYIDKLKWLDKKYVTLWDVEYERGWLVNGNAALLHLLRSSLHHSSTDKFSSDFHFQPQDFQESKNPHTLDSALEVLRNSKNQQLELYDKDIDIRQGCATNSRTTVKDRVEELYEILEKLFDHTATSEASSKGLNAKSRFQDHLEGWDFIDIATNRDPFFIKRTTLGLSMLGWPDLVRATSAITLFGKGFGELIEAVEAQQGGACKEWMTMPKNRNLLCGTITKNAPRRSRSHIYETVDWSFPGMRQLR
ncbi:uncharacterized protein FIESC28_02456 [Fusarium coffeatum]|uniref:Uncharacterized protein n=1 Tax=Fusarium coffeatum TaxID=231269 RepID=A0A366S5T0_9HYPO|nr:uncharacterized protein FIESC28_02456 [Fusarium coffeatum]RBR24683.1 hypothetical protein FIESC28_02456 [Fusarium coffeatum]